MTMTVRDTMIVLAVARANAALDAIGHKYRVKADDESVHVGGLVAHLINGRERVEGAPIKLRDVAIDAMCELRLLLRAKECDAPSSTMTDAEAEAMLAKLSEHFKVPVMPITRYCSALHAWQDALNARAYRAREALWPGSSTNLAANEAMKAEIATAWDGLSNRSSVIRNYLGFAAETDRVGETFFQIKKSNLLWRLLYCGEPLRTKLCPKHKGVWSGVPHDPTPCGCDLTGWLPEPSGVVVTVPEK